MARIETCDEVMMELETKCLRPDTDVATRIFFSFFSSSHEILVDRSRLTNGKGVKSESDLSNDVYSIYRGYIKKDLVWQGDISLSCEWDHYGLDGF